MAVRLRLKRTGRTNRPFYRIAAFHHTTRRDGNPVEDLGWYDPLIREREKSFKLDEERAKYWISQGAQPSETVRSILKLRGIRQPVATTLARSAAGTKNAKSTKSTKSGE